MSSWRHLESSIASENSPRSSNKISSPSVHWIASWLWRTVAFLWGPRDEYQTWMISKNTGLEQDNQCLHTELPNYLVLEFFFFIYFGSMKSDIVMFLNIYIYSFCNFLHCVGITILVLYFVDEYFKSKDCPPSRC